jgi:hypothetical protein
MNQNWTSRLAALARTMCVVLGAAIWFASSADARAGVIVISEAAIGEMSSPAAPVTPVPADPVVGDLEQASLLLSTTNGTGGAGSHSTTNGPTTGLVAVVTEGHATAQTSLVSRLFPFSRVSLPSPLEDRFFRPPRV